MKVILVWGPPCSGKTTLIQKKLQKDELAFDPSTIASALAMTTEHKTDGQNNKNARWVALNLRAAFLRKAEVQKVETVYLSCTYPTKDVLKILSDYDVETLEAKATQTECLERLDKDDTRKEKDVWRQLIEEWFQKYGRKEERAMKIEIRSDSVRISGYVNATEKKSRPVVTPRGKVIEVVEPRAFADAIKKAGNVTCCVDHDTGHAYAETSNGTLELYEDNIGLHADVTITDPAVMDMAKRGEIRGWSFGMTSVVDEMEPRAEGELPIRHVKGMDLDHVSLIVRQNPIYSATSVEVRAESEIELETRAESMGESIEYSHEWMRERLRRL